MWVFFWRVPTYLDKARLPRAPNKTLCPENILVATTKETTTFALLLKLFSQNCNQLFHVIKGVLDNILTPGVINNFPLESYFKTLVITAYLANSTSFPTSIQRMEAFKSFLWKYWLTGMLPTAIKCFRNVFQFIFVNSPDSIQSKLPTRRLSSSVQPSRTFLTFLQNKIFLCKVSISSSNWVFDKIVRYL